MENLDRPAHDEAPRPIAPGADPRRLYVVIALLVGVIVLLIVRPWGDDTGSPPVPSAATGQAAAGDGGSGATTTAGGGSSGGASSPNPAGPDSEDPYADHRVTCGSPSGWRAATLQVWAGRATLIRSWIAIEPVDATGPLDPAIPFAPVATDVVTAIGYCAPLDEQERPPGAAIGALWAIVDDVALPLTPLLLEPSSPNALGALWRPATEISPGGEAWPPGSYVIELATPTGAYRRWLGIQIEDLARMRSPSASPPASTLDPGSPSPGLSPGASALP